MPVPMATPVRSRREDSRPAAVSGRGLDGPAHGAAAGMKPVRCASFTADTNCCVVAALAMPGGPSERALSGTFVMRLGAGAVGGRQDGAGAAPAMPDAFVRTMPAERALLHVELPLVLVARNYPLQR